MTQADPPEVMDRFEAEMGLVDAIASQIHREVGDFLDVRELVSYGLEGLLTAARRYDPDRGIPFRKFAYHRVRGAILDGMRAYSHLPRRAHEKVRALRAANLVASGFFDDSSPASSANLTPEAADDRIADHLAVLATAMAVGLSGQEAVEDGERVIVVDDPPDAKAERDELMKIVMAELPNLSEQEAQFVRRHFLRDENVEDIAASMGLSKSWGSRILTRGITKLSKKLRAVA